MLVLEIDISAPVRTSYSRADDTLKCLRSHETHRLRSALEGVHALVQNLVVSEVNMQSWAVNFSSLTERHLRLILREVGLSALLWRAADAMRKRMRCKVVCAQSEGWPAIVLQTAVTS